MWGWLVIALIGFTLLFLLRVQLTADIHRAERTLGRIHLQIAGLRREWLLELLRTPQGHRLVVAGQDGIPRDVAPEKLRGGPADHMLSVLRRADRARQFLLRHIHPERVDALLLLHTENAASTAMLTGAARTAATFLPPRWRERMRIRIQPDFFHEHTTIQARCILTFRLGTIIITTVMLLAALAVQRVQSAREAS